ncbi:hypothetical protein TNCV_2240791 [Trichonephila clavipes]|nr:hypothetical protein TNCV_2240791 [Trichonephila clavipes]
MKQNEQKVYKLPPPTPAHVPAETNKRPLKQQPGPSSKRKRVFITPVIRPPVLIARPSTALATPQPMSIPEPPVLTTPQILLPDPSAELTTPLVTRSTTCADPSTRSTTCGRDLGADPFGRIFNRSDHGVRIWRLLGTSPGPYPRNPVV